MSTKLYSLKKFEAVAEKTNLGSSTVNALREVLVNGLSNVETFEKHGILAPQISRGLKLFREKEAELAQITKEQKESAMIENLDDVTKSIYLKQSVMKSEDVRAAREIIGNRNVFFDAEPGNQYTGAVVYCGQSNIFQKCGNKCIIHDKGNLSKLPKVNSIVNIEYPKDKKLALVVPHIEKEKEISR